jgi:2-polyprenyl-6-methoxyphenol hydroxylase-like FAD-dependent oxidoreductase
MSMEGDGAGRSRADVPVLIVGAGPTGLVLALWLTRLGVRVRIIDRTAEPGTTSRALAVQARTLEFYRQVGLADAVIAGGVQIANLNFWVKGTRAARVPLRRIGEGLSPYRFALVFPQDAHERLLIERLDALGVKVERQTELLRFEQDGREVHATLRRSGGPEEVCNADYLAGCDGASSTVREQLAVGFAGGTYTGLFYVADVEATGPATDEELHADLEDADFLLVFPLKGKGRLRLVGVVRDVPGRERGELTFDDVKGKAIGHLKLDIEKVNWFSTYLNGTRASPDPVDSPDGLRPGLEALLGSSDDTAAPRDRSCRDRRSARRPAGRVPIRPGPLTTRAPEPFAIRS